MLASALAACVCSLRGPTAASAAPKTVTNPRGVGDVQPAVRWAGRRTAVVAAAVVASSWLGSTAHAASVRVGAPLSSGTVFYAADPGEINTVSVAESGDDLRVRDTGAPLRALPPCRAVNEHEALCRPAAVVPIFIAELGDGNDSVTIEAPTPEPVPGLPPVVNFLNGSTRLDGGPGDDTLVGGGEVDEFDGGPGADRIDGGDDPYGPDLPGHDRLTYADRTQGVTVDLGAGVGGEPGEGDRVTAVEGVTGGAGADTLKSQTSASLHGGPGDDRLLGGSGNYDTLLGGPGADRISGAGGDDYLWGGSGNDRLDGGRGNDDLTGEEGCGVGVQPSAEGDDDRVDGGPGNDHLCERFGRNLLVGGAGADHLEGGNGRDTLLGGAGRDRLQGGPDRDRFSAGAGDDSVYSRDRAAERVRCGSGRDRSGVDRRDRPSGCERVRYGRGGGGG